MAKTYENDCVGCDYCISCGLKHSPHYFCDSCEDEFDSEELYYDDVTDEELCATCFLKRYKTVKERER